MPEKRAMLMYTLIADLSGAEIEHVVNEVGLLSVKDAIANNIQIDVAQVSANHFLQTINSLQYQI